MAANELQLNVKLLCGFKLHGSESCGKNVSIQETAARRKCSRPSERLWTGTYADSGTNVL
jgi:hypothetical protein